MAETDEPVAEWNFIALGDSRQQRGTWDYVTEHYTHDNASNPVRAAVMNAVVENNPESEFIIHTGDMVMSGAEQDDWDRYFEDMENVTASGIPVYYAVGNHEIYSYSLGPGLYGPYDDDFTTYMANVEMPGNERYYSFDYNGQIHFIIINTEENWKGQFEITEEQSTWIENDLGNNTLNFTVAVFHRPCYSVRDSGRAADASSIRSVLDPFLTSYGVDLVFSGHDHYYYRAYRNEIMYVTAGGAGADLYMKESNSQWQGGDVYFSGYHYCNVTVSEVNSEVTVQVDVVRLNYDDGSTTIADSFEIPYTSTYTSESTTTATTTTTTVSLPVYSTLLCVLAIVSFKKQKKNR